MSGLVMMKEKGYLGYLEYLSNKCQAMFAKKLPLLFRCLLDYFEHAWVVVETIVHISHIPKPNLNFPIASTSIGSRPPIQKR